MFKPPKRPQGDTEGVSEKTNGGTGGGYALERFLHFLFGRLFQRVMCFTVVFVFLEVFCPSNVAVTVIICCIRDVAAGGCWVCTCPFRACGHTDYSRYVTLKRGTPEIEYFEADFVCVCYFFWGGEGFLNAAALDYLRRMVHRCRLIGDKAIIVLEVIYLGGMKVFISTAVLVRD